jgi:hypothetical protein
MTPEKIKERIELLILLGKEVHEDLLKLHILKHGDVNEIVFLPEKIPELVECYNGYLEAYRSRHGIVDLVDGDKIAAFTGILIMRFKPFVSNTGEINTIYSALANETYALRVSELFLRKRTFGIAKGLHKQLLYCFSNCYESDNCMNTWVIATMSHHLREGTITEERYAD